MDQATGEQAKLVALGTGLFRRRGVVVDSNGDLISTSQDPVSGGGEPFRSDVSASTLSVISSGGELRAPENVAIDTNGGLLITDPAARNWGRSSG